MKKLKHKHIDIATCQFVEAVFCITVLVIVFIIIPIGCIYETSMNRQREDEMKYAIGDQVRIKVDGRKGIIVEKWCYGNRPEYVIRYATNNIEEQSYDRMTVAEYEIESNIAKTGTEQ